MRKRKGDLTNNALSIIIAVIGLGLLFFGVMKLYQLKDSEEQKNVQRALANIEDKINALENGQEGLFAIQGFSGSNKWFLAGYGLSVDPNLRPAKCYFKSCLCICTGEDASRLHSVLQTVPVCQQKGFCRFFDISSVKVETVSKYEYQVGGNFVKESDPVIFLLNQLTPLNISKNNGLVITYIDPKVEFVPAMDFNTGKLEGMKDSTSLGA